MFLSRRASTLFPKLENTYKLGPDDSETFNVSAAEEVISDQLNYHLTNHKYNQDTSAKMALTLSGLIKSEVKKLNIPRYKIVCQVIINQRKGQAINVSSRGLMEEKFDNFASVSFTNDEIIAVGIVHGFYFN